MTFAGIPYGTRYTVTEEDLKKEGYRVACSNEAGTVVKDTEVLITNRKNAPIPTGADQTGTAFPLLLVTAVIAGCLILERIYQRKNL